MHINHRVHTTHNPYPRNIQPYCPHSEVCQKTQGVIGVCRLRRIFGPKRDGVTAGGGEKTA
jgi:hypothetical protein